MGIFESHLETHYILESRKELDLDNHPFGVPVYYNLYLHEESNGTRILSYMGKKFISRTTDNRTFLYLPYSEKRSFFWSNDRTIRVTKILNGRFGSIYGTRFKKANGRKMQRFWLQGENTDPLGNSVLAENRVELKLDDQGRLGLHNADEVTAEVVKDNKTYTHFNQELRKLFAVLRTQLRLGAAPKIFTDHTNGLQRPYGSVVNRITADNPFSDYLVANYREKTLESSGLMGKIRAWMASRNETLLPEIWKGVSFYTVTMQTEKPENRLTKAYKMIQQFYLQSECVTIVPRNQLLGDVNNGNQQSELL